VSGLPKNVQWSARFLTMLTPDATGVHHFTLNGSSEGV
jgi:hypothetical protein